jgi:hypothetical protein
MWNGRNCKSSEKGAAGSYTMPNGKRKILLRVTFCHSSILSSDGATVDKVKIDNWIY